MKHFSEGIWRYMGNKILLVEKDYVKWEMLEKFYEREGKMGGKRIL